MLRATTLHDVLHRRLRPALLTLVLTLTSLVGVTLASAPPAKADGCYTWSRTLQQGASGADVTQLQIRVAGWAGYDVRIAMDGVSGRRPPPPCAGSRRRTG